MDGLVHLGIDEPHSDLGDLMSVFRETISQFAPPWWAERWGRALLDAAGSAFDTMAQRALDGRRNGIPWAGPGQKVQPRIVSAADNGSGLIRLTLDTTAALRDVPEVWIYSSATTGGLVLDGTWRISVVDGTRIDLRESTFTGAYVNSAVMSFVGLKECDEEVLPWHARDRGIRLYDTEPLLSKRYRLAHWRQLWKRRGLHLGELENLQPFWRSTMTSLLPTMHIVHQSNEGTPTATWHTLHPDGSYSVHRANPSNFDYNGQPSKKSRFFLLIHWPEDYASILTYDDGVSVYDGGGIYDGVGPALITDIVDAVREAKAAHSRLAAVIATPLQPDDLIPGLLGEYHPFDPADTAQTAAEGWTSLPVGNWGTTIDPDTLLATRPPWASWLYEDPGPEDDIEFP